MEKIHCIFCGALAEIIRQYSSDIVVCNHCYKENEYGTYRILLDDWLDEMGQKRIFKERRAVNDRQAPYTYAMLDTDRRKYRDKKI